MNNIEYINQARKLLTEDYKTKHTNEYNSWMAAHQNSWMQPHVVVPFPPFVVSSALAPFKATVSAPTEEAVVAKALELYKQFNPPLAAVEPVVATPPVVVESTVEEPVVASVEEETAVDTIVEEPAIEETAVAPVVEEIAVSKLLTSADAIHKIFQEPIAEALTSMPVESAMPATLEQALNAVPQPAEELAKVKNAGGILPSVLQRLQDMKAKWSSTGDKDV